jgi:S1-C subfamily serine protease
MEKNIKKILDFTKHFSKEILIGLILAVIAAVGFEAYKSKVNENNLEVNKKAVATVVVNDSHRNPLGQASGVFITSTGLLVTNCHVIAIEGADISKTIAKLSTGAQYSLKDIKTLDKKVDIALLQFEGTEIPYAKYFGDSDKLISGEKVIAIGSPLGQENSVSVGVIAHPARELLGIKFIQFTAPISPGSSGGGLFNKDGKAIVGVTKGTLQDKKHEAQNINLAIPINLVKSILSGSEKELGKQTPEYYYAQGQIAENMGNDDKALADYQRAISIDDKYADAYIGLGGIYFDKGRYDLEVSYYEKAVDIKPNSYEFLYYLGTAYEDIQQYDKAAEAYSKALRLKPNYKDALHDYAVLLIAEGDCNQASKLILELKELDVGQAKKLEFLMRRTSCR